MQITLTKEQVREAFGELRYMGADYCYKYDKETRKKTEEVEAFIKCQDRMYKKYYIKMYS